MATIFDIMPRKSHVIVETGSGETLRVEVRALSTGAVADLFARYPDLLKIVEDLVVRGTEDAAIDWSTVLRSAPAAVASVVAAGTSDAAGRPAAEAAALELDPDIALQLAQEIIRISFSNFLQRMGGMGGALSANAAIANAGG
ncbi:MAG: phage pre-tape measure protein [Niveispirillum sp.]|uniref:phage pre-tape measure protein n=1 Tax=Niveispirillum sp. TaxID=1917217 RepID=UPI004036256F